MATDPGKTFWGRNPAGLNEAQKMAVGIDDDVPTAIVEELKRAQDTYPIRLLLSGHIHAIHQNVRFLVLIPSVPHLI